MKRNIKCIAYTAFEPTILIFAPVIMIALAFIKTEFYRTIQA